MSMTELERARLRDKCWTEFWEKIALIYADLDHTQHEVQQAA